MGRRAIRTDYEALINLKTSLISQLRNLNPTLAADLDAIQLPWYTVRNAAEGGGPDDTTEIFIYESIGGWFGIPVADFVKELNEVKTKKIDVRINSPGGSLFDSIAIYNALVKKNAYVTTYVDALAASGASIIAMAGDEIVMMVGSQMMIHDALGIEIGNEADFLEFADFLGKQSNNIASVYANQAGGTIEDWRAMMRAETWMFADEAVTLGLATRIYSKPSDEPEADEDEESDEPDGDEPPMMEEESTEDDEPSDEDSEDDDEEEEDDVEALMSKKHTLSNRGFRYAGRGRAPTPPVNDWDSFVNTLLR